MSKHIDLIAVGALLLAFVVATHWRGVLPAGDIQTRVFRTRVINPVFATPPRVPHLPRVQY